MSHLLDCELFGLDAGAHLAVNLVLHAGNSELLFILLARLTGRLQASVPVAALFALHPLNVESVAWASQRKSVLSGLFFLTTIHAYVWYTRKPTRPRLGATAGCFALGLFCRRQAGFWRDGEAVPELERALALTGGASQAEANLGSAYIRTGRLPEGIRCLERTAAKVPLQAVSCSELGDAHAQSGKLAEAVTSYQRALAVDSGLDVARYRLVRTYLPPREHGRCQGSGRAPASSRLWPLAGCQQRLALYREGRPYRDPPGTGANGAPFGGKPE